MELGNFVFGHSRGEFQIERGVGFEEELERLFNSYDPKRDNSWREYGSDFENETFMVHRYCWCEEDDCPWCNAEKPNFLYKPLGFEIMWYKYPLRDSYSNAKISLNKFRKIIDDCIGSLGK